MENISYIIKSSAEDYTNKIVAAILASNVDRQLNQSCETLVKYYEKILEQIREID